MNTITQTPGLTALEPLSSGTNESQGKGFAKALQEVNGALNQADQMAAGFAQGKVGLTEAVLTAEHADTSFGLVVAVRNRALAAYQEIFNMTV